MLIWGRLRRPTGINPLATDKSLTTDKSLATDASRYNEGVVLGKFLAGVKRTQHFNQVRQVMAAAQFTDRVHGERR